MGKVKRIRSNAGTGGKLSRSNTSHYGRTQEVKAAAKKQRLLDDCIAESAFKGWALREQRRLDAMDHLLELLGTDEVSDEDMAKIEAEIYGK